MNKQDLIISELDENMYTRFLKGFFRDAFEMSNTNECIVKFDSSGEVISIISYDEYYKIHGTNLSKPK
tara:strand:+ start:2892 stop:3095 length:204 start_codon:yes stop_codon:yes gene_type:complete